MKIRAMEQTESVSDVLCDVFCLRSAWREFLSTVGVASQPSRRISLKCQLLAG